MAKKRGITNLVKEFPSLAAEWDYEKNGDLDPTHITNTYGPKVHWKCPQGPDHEWQRIIGERIKSGQGCPFCSNKKVSVTNCLAVLRPDLAKEWHESKNEKTPSDYVIGSGARIWWRCSKVPTHNWQIRICDRTDGSNGSKCPYCRKIIATPDYNLVTEFPEIAAQWHPTKNDKSLPEEYFPSTLKKVWWKCSKGPDHEWRSSISTRTGKRKAGCPYCANKKLSITNSLAAVSSDICIFWDTTKNKKLPSQIIYGSRSPKYYFKCPVATDHKWTDSPKDASERGGCPFCNKTRVSSTYNLSVVFPRVAALWDYKRNYPKRPEDFVPNSHERVYWQCKRFSSHTWRSTINARAQRDGHCPKCTRATSAPELRILAELSSLKVQVKQRHRINKIEIDLYFPRLKLGIEYDGVFYHKDKHDKDTRKNRDLARYGINIIRVREKPLEKISDWDIQIKAAGINKRDLGQLVMTIQQLSDRPIQGVKKYLQATQFINDHIYREYLQAYPDPIAGQSFADLYPEVAKEWDYKKNYPLTPNNFLPSSSSMKFWWVCDKCGGSYDMLIASKTKPKRGCPFCSRHRVSRLNRLSEIYPHLVGEWHPTLNGEVTPDDKSKGSRWIAWWQCKLDSSHIYDMAIQSRTGSRPQSCPYCARKRSQPEKTVQWLNPPWLKEFQGFLKNEEAHLRIGDLHISSGRRVKWLCADCGSFWNSKIVERVGGLCCLCTIRRGNLSA